MVDRVRVQDVRTYHMFHETLEQDPYINITRFLNRAVHERTLSLDEIVQGIANLLERRDGATPIRAVAEQVYKIFLIRFYQPEDVSGAFEERVWASLARLEGGLSSEVSEVKDLLDRWSEESSVQNFIRMVVDKGLSAHETRCVLGSLYQATNLTDNPWLGGEILAEYERIRASL